MTRDRRSADVVGWRSSEINMKLFTRQFTVKANYARGVRGREMAQLVEALRYKSEGRGFDSR